MTFRPHPHPLRRLRIPVRLALLALLATAAGPAASAGVSEAGTPVPAASPPSPGETHEHGQGHAGDGPTVEHRFGDAEHWAERFEDPERDRWQLPDSVVAVLADRPDLVVADIGSATGYFPVRFARACPDGRVYGIDIEPEMVFYLNDRARREGLDNLVSLLGAPDDPHLPRAVDLVFLCNTYHHIGDRRDYFRRLRDALNPEGRVAVVDYRPGAARGPDHKLSPNAVEAELRQAGFRLAARHEFLPDQYFLVFVAGEE